MGNSVNVAQSFDKGNYSFSLGNTTSDGIVRSTGMDRYNVKLSGEAQLHDNWTTGFNGNFVTSKIRSKEPLMTVLPLRFIRLLSVILWRAYLPISKVILILRIRSVRTGSMMETGRATI